MKQIWGVANAEIDKVWSDVSRLLERIKDCDKTLTEIYQGLRDRKYQLWTGWEDHDLSLVLVTETYTLKGRQVCSLFLCAGNDMDRWLDYLLKQGHSVVTMKPAKRSIIEKCNLPEYVTIS